MIVTPTLPPQDVLNVGVFGGHWYRMDGTGAHAIVYWKGGPESVDRDVVIHWIEAEIPRQGYGTLLLNQIKEWADERRLNMTAYCDTGQVRWWSRRGFAPMKNYRDGMIVGRTAPAPAPTGL